MAGKLLVSTWDLVPRPGVEPKSPALGAAVLATRPPKKSPGFISYWLCHCRQGITSIKDGNIKLLPITVSGSNVSSLTINLSSSIGYERITESLSTGICLFGK